MKKLVFLLPAFLVLASFAASAKSTGSDVDPRLEKNFQSEFVGAENVKWSKAEGGLTRASFIWGDHHTLAFYDENSQLVGCVRGLFYSQLPLPIIRSVERQFVNPVVLEIVEITNNDGVNYALVLEQKDKRYRVKMNSLGEITDKEKIKK